VVLEPAHEVVHDFANHLPCRFKRFPRNGGTQRDEVGNEMDVRLQSRKEFRFEHQSL
jgi:hypothetical protein